MLAHARPSPLTNQPHCFYCYARKHYVVVCATLGLMRGGVQVWKRGLSGHGIRHATAYALQGGCDAVDVDRQVAAGVDAATSYGPEGAPTVVRHVATADGIREDRLDQDELRAWIDATDPATEEQRGRTMTSPDAHLLYDATINAPKSYSLACILDPDLREEYDALMDRVTEQTVTAWRDELSTRRGKGGTERIGVAQVEVVQLDHERSRSLDPHAHRHLWLNAKVQGQDGKWSNVDSQQVFRHQVLVNARGELAARTDQRWRDALTRHGYTLDQDGEIAELAHLTQPMSKRAAQIDRNKAQLEAEWRAEHPSDEPSPRLIESWDRRAWAMDRAQKPADLDEDQWRDQVRREIADIDPALVTRRDPAPDGPAHRGPAAAQDEPAREPLDRDRLTAYAVSWTDQRAIRSQGRFSRIDLRAGATMAVAQAQLTRDPDELDRLIDQVETRALDQCQSLAPEGVRGPDDVKTLRLTTVGQARAEVTERAAVRAALGDPTPATEQTIGRAIATVDTERAADGEDPVTLDDRQVAAARAVAGASPLVAVEGPAGAGKTTMLTVAERAIADDGHRMVTVAPTMKAAQVAQAEIGSDGSSLHALLFQHGFRWTSDEAGRSHWSRLHVGDVDQDGSVYQGPPSTSRLDTGDTIVCDEAGMVDLDAMRGLLTLADETGSRLALIGDPNQVRPVGHSGAMSLVQEQTPDEARVDLHAIHRFRDADDPRKPDTAYAEISRDLRTAGTPDKAREVAAWLDTHGHLDRVDDSTQQVTHAADAWMSAHGLGESIAVMADDNQTVDAINDAVQQARLDAGQITDDRSATGRNDQTLHVGDHVTTRKNHRDPDGFTVANREQWTIEKIHRDGSVTVNGGTDRRTERLDADYTADHVTLGYASTVHGAQGVTARRAVTVVSDTTTSAQLYVGMSRGKHANTALVAAADESSARQLVSDSIMRERNDLSDEQLRALVAGDLKRAGVDQDAERPDASGSWRDRPFGDLVDPIGAHDRLTRDRDRVARVIRDAEDQRHVKAHELDDTLRPALAVARRDGLAPQLVDYRAGQVDKAEKRLATLDGKLDTTRGRLARLDARLEQVTREIQHRATLSEDTAREERDAREHAAVHDPAKLTDEIRRPYGLALSLPTERKNLDAERGDVTTTRDRAIAQLDAAALRTADANAADQHATAAARTAHTDYDHELETRTSTYTARITDDLDQVRDATQRAESAGILRRRAACRDADQARADFVDTWGDVPDLDHPAGWIDHVAVQHAQDDLDSSPLRQRMDDADADAGQARATATAATRDEDALHGTVREADAQLHDLDARDGDLTRETTLRRNLPREKATSENRLRHARAAKRSARQPSTSAARPATARPDVDEPTRPETSPRIR